MCRCMMDVEALKALKAPRADSAANALAVDRLFIDIIAKQTTISVTVDKELGMEAAEWRTVKSIAMAFDA